MHRLSPLRSGAFRFALSVAAVFALGTACLLVMVDQVVGKYAAEVASDSVVAEAGALRDQDAATGRTETVQSIGYRENSVREHQLRYLLVGGDGRRQAGSLPVSAAHAGWSNLVLANPQPDEDSGPTLSMMAFGTRLGDGAMLVVASDTSDIVELRNRLRFATIGFGAAIVLLSLIGGFAVGSLFLRRLDRVNASVGRIIDGSLAERLPAIGMSPEFDQLSANLNSMLDRIEGLMEGMRQVSTDIAHDLRLPLTRLRQQLEDLQVSLASQPAEILVEKAIQQTDQMLKIFRALLRISALEAGNVQQRFEAFDLSEMLDEIFAAYFPVAEDADHKLVQQIEPGVIAKGDRELLTQAVTNLVENALVHTPPCSTMTLSLAHHHGAAVIAVSDDGPGVPAQERAKVLGRFYRLDASRTSPGVGLGLALVNAIAGVHRGKVRLLENAPGLRVELIIPDHGQSDGNRPGS